MQKVNLFWFRRDLRLDDNAGLYHALKKGIPVLPIFIFDKNILDKLEDKKDARVEFIHQAILNLNEQLKELGSSIKVFYSTPEKVFKNLAKEYAVQSVYTNHDYEPYADERDASVKDFLIKNKIEFKTYKDQCIFEKDEVTKDDGKPYTVFTPYSRKWKLKMNDFYVKPYPNKKYFKNFIQTSALIIPTLKEIGFEKSELDFPSKTISKSIVTNYKEQRDFPAIKGTSKLSVHLRFGTVISYSLHIKPILDASCNQNCHNGTGQGSRDLTGTDFAQIQSATNDGTATPGDWGSLYGTMSWDPNYGNDMPKGGSKLSDCDLAKIRKWAAAGAPQN